MTRPVPDRAELDRRHRARRPPAKHVGRSAWRDGFPAPDPEDARRHISEPDWLRLVVASDPGRHDAREGASRPRQSRGRRKVRSLCGLKVKTRQRSSQRVSRGEGGG